MTDQGKTGNARIDRLGETYARRCAVALVELDRLCSGHAAGMPEIVALKMKIGTTDQMRTLVIVSALDEEGGPMVAFHDGMSPSEALVGAVNRILNHDIKWKEDQYGR